jgi:hypothetical protein
VALLNCPCSAQLYGSAARRASASSELPMSHPVLTLAAELTSARTLELLLGDTVQVPNIKEPHSVAAVGPHLEDDPHTSFQEARSIGKILVASEANELAVGKLRQPDRLADGHATHACFNTCPRCRLTEAWCQRDQDRRIPFAICR